MFLFIRSDKCFVHPIWRSRRIKVDRHNTFEEKNVSGGGANTLDKLKKIGHIFHEMFLDDMNIYLT